MAFRSRVAVQKRRPRQRRRRDRARPVRVVDSVPQLVGETRVPVRDDPSVADLHAMVRKTLAAVNFVVLSTAEDAVPTPVFYAHDSQPAIYWDHPGQRPTPRYVEHAGQCGLVIVNTSARSREYRGVYARAAVRRLTTRVRWRRCSP